MKFFFVFILILSLTKLTPVQSGSISANILDCAEIIFPAPDVSSESQHIRNIVISPHSEILAAVAGNKLTLYSTDTYEVISTLSLPYDAIAAISWSPDSTQIAASVYSENPKDILPFFYVVIWDIATDSEVARLEDIRVANLAWAPNSPYIALTSVEGVSLWNLQNDEVEPLDSETYLEFISWNPDGSELVGVNQYGYSWLWLSELNEIKVSLLPYRFDNIAWSSDEQFLSVSSNIVGMYIFNVREAAEALFSLDTSVFSYTDALLSSLAWSPNNEYLAAGSNRGLLLFDVKQDFKVLNYFDPETVPVFKSIAWGQDGENLFALSNDRTIYAWNIPCLVALEM